MVNRVLLIAFTSAATCGLSTAAIAEGSGASSIEWEPSSAIILSQADENTDNPSSQQPSAAIQSLQSRLLELGYYSGPVTGIFDDPTREALGEFQQEQGLVSTGILDPLTQQRLADPTGESSDPDADSADPDEAGAEPSEIAPSLDLPPVSENGESLEPETPPSEAETNTSAEDGATETSGETGNGAEGEAIAQGDGDAPPDAEAATNDSSRFPLLILIGAVILVLGGLGGGLTLWFSKRRGQAQKASESQTDFKNVEDGSQGDHPSRSEFPKSSPLPKSSRPSAAGHNLNGQPGVSQSESPASALDVQHQSMPLGNVAEPRVAKVNIVDELVQDLQQPDPELRRRAIWELGQRGNSSAMQPLVSLLTQVDSQEQSLILAALAEITSQTLKPMNRAVMIALQSEDAEVRKNAIRDLTKVFDSFKQSGKMLGHVAIDDDPDVRQTANWALDQLNKMRPSSPDAAGLLGESDTSKQQRLTDDGTSSK